MAITQLHSLAHDTGGTIYHNSLVMINATHFILAYGGVDVDGFIKTFSINGSYESTEIDSLEFDTASGTYNSLVKIDSTHFALAYSGNSNDGYIATFVIDGSYQITAVDLLEHDTAMGIYNSLVLINSTHLALAYTDYNGDGWIKTFSIDANADNITLVDSLEHEAANGAHNSLVLIDNTHLALACQGADYDGFLKTFSIDANADNIALIDSLEFETTNLQDVSIALIDSTHIIMFATTGYSAVNKIKTFSLDGSYDNLTEIDTINFDNVQFAYPSWCKLDATHFMLSATDSDGDGFLYLISFDGAYDNLTVDASLEHDASDGTDGSIVAISASYVVLAYKGTSVYGYIKTFSTGISAPEPPVEATGNRFRKPLKLLANSL